MYHKINTAGFTFVFMTFIDLSKWAFGMHNKLLSTLTALVI